MSFYIRKSVRVGPFRFNLSKSGIGLSTGVRGFRLGTGPRGNYIHMGRKGLYYRKTLHAPTQRRENADPAPEHYSVDSDPTHDPLMSITSTDVSRMVDSSSVALLGELEAKRKKIRTGPVSLILTATTIAVLVGNGLTLAITIPVGIALTVLTVFAWHRDMLAKSVVIMYDLDDHLQDAYKSLHNSLTSLSACDALWHITARGNVHDSRYHAGAGALIERKRVLISEDTPPYVKTNISTTCVRLSNKRLYFFPDRVLLWSSIGSIGAIDYDDIKIDIETTRFIEEDDVPHDATIVDKTWRFVNKNGSPDRRFNNNRELPICEYGTIQLQSQSGFNELLHASRTATCASFEGAITRLAAFQRESKNQVVSRTRDASIPVEGSIADTTPRPPVPEQEHQPISMSQIHGVFFDALCCVMVSDGRASRSEKQHIRGLLSKAKVGWSTEQIDEKISQFIDKVRANGYQRVESEMLENVALFKRIGRQDTLLQCIRSLSEVDQKLDQREDDLIRRIQFTLQ